MRMKKSFDCLGFRSILFLRRRNKIVWGTENYYSNEEELRLSGFQKLSIPTNKKMDCVWFRKLSIPTKMKLDYLGLRNLVFLLRRN